MLCLLWGCMSQIRPVQNAYAVTVEFIDTISLWTNTVEITARLGDEFTVKSRDKAGDYFEVAGTLLRRGRDKFRIQKLVTAFVIDGGSTSSRRTMSDLDLNLDEPWGFAVADGVEFFEEFIRVTRKGLLIAPPSLRGMHSKLIAP